MRHFFDQDSVLSDEAQSELLNAARRELRNKQMNLAEMSTKMDLVCLNAGNQNQFIPRGMDSLILTKNMSLNQTISKEFTADLNKLIESTPNDVFGYVLGNIQVKNVFNYLNTLFSFSLNYKFNPLILLHFSNDELVEYLVDYLNSSVVDGVKRKIEVFDDRSSKPWKEISKSSELKSIDRSVREPIVLDKPFFSDISLRITKMGSTNVVNSSLGKLKSIQGHFNRIQSTSGEFTRSKNKLFLKIKDIESFKLATSQSKNLIGISYKGEYIASSAFITHNVGLSAIALEDIDFITFRVNRKPTDIKLEEIKVLEVNLDTQQVSITRGVGSSEFHIARFNRLKLHKGNRVLSVHKIVFFNRGSSNFEQIQKYFGTRYTEFEKARQILKERGELGLLSARNIVTGDMVSHLVMSNMKLLGLIPFDTHCVGFDPETIKNPASTKNMFNSWFKELQDIFSDILDISQTPAFTEHNFNRLLKNIKLFIASNDSMDINPEILNQLISELEALTAYMDDFFKLNVYQAQNETLETETVSGLDDESPVEEAIPDSTEQKLDEGTKKFISENFAFFEKRKLVQSALLKTEKMMFYFKQIKPHANSYAITPDMIVFSNTRSKIENYRYTAYPALALSSVLEKTSLVGKDENEELSFVKFMRDFTQRAYLMAQKLNKSFHHQYKHTLSELGFIADEKLNQLRMELELLESPDNKEEAYKQLLEKITSLFHKHLRAKQENIVSLEKERSHIQELLGENWKRLERLLKFEVPEDRRDSLLASLPDTLEKMKVDLIATHRERLNRISPIFNAFVKLHAYAIEYFQKVLDYAELFQKALWTHRYQISFDRTKKEARHFFTLTTEELAANIKEREEYRYDKEQEETIHREINSLTSRLSGDLYKLSLIPAKDLFKSQYSEEDELTSYLAFYKEETVRLVKLIKTLQSSYLNLNSSQNQLFKKQEELVTKKLEKTENELKLTIAKMILKDPNCQSDVDNMSSQTKGIPKEIKKELGSIRAALIKALTVFKSNVKKEKLEEMINYDRFLGEATRRKKINDVSKELVNYSQGIKAITEEREGEIKDFDYLKSQESNLETVAMSKALPSTRILIKTLYIPMIEQEKKLLNRANQFLSDIISSEERIVKALTTTFFKNRYCFPQFTNGCYCVDTSGGTKDHTEKNVYSTYLLLSEKHPKACVEVQGKVNKIGIEKLEIQGVDDIRNRISQIWHGHSDERVVFLPPSLSLRDALELCEYKDTICINSPKNQKSIHSLILVYAQKFRYEEIKINSDLLKVYNQAILSNIFINIDDVDVFNNRDSLFEACVKETFGNCGDQISKNIYQRFLATG